MSLEGGRSRETTRELRWGKVWRRRLLFDTQVDSGDDLWCVERDRIA